MPSYCTKKYISAECCPIVQQCTIGQSEQFFLFYGFAMLCIKNGPYLKLNIDMKKPGNTHICLVTNNFEVVIVYVLNF